MLVVILILLSVLPVKLGNLIAESRIWLSVVVVLVDDWRLELESGHLLLLLGLLLRCGLLAS